MKRACKTMLLCGSTIAVAKFTEEASKRGVEDDGQSFAVAMADINADGFLDMFVTDSKSSNHLYINKGAADPGKFIEHTSSNLAAAKDASRGAVFADVNGDGKLDLYVTDTSVENHLFMGDGMGNFKDVTAGVEDPGMGQGACFADVDNDGDMDLFVANFGQSNNLYLNNGKGIFSNVTAKAGLTSTGNSGFGCAFADLDGDGDMDLYVSNSGQSNKLYMNDGKGTFTETSAEAGCAGDTGMGRGVSIGDLNGDGHLDIYTVAPQTANQMFLGDGTGKFTDATKTCGAGDSGPAQGVNIADVDGDGDLDIYVANIFSASTLYENDGKGHFTDVSSKAGVNYHLFGQGVAFGDVDNDGDLDMYVNTYGTPPAGWPSQDNKFLINQGKVNPYIKVRPTDANGKATRLNTEVRLFEAGTRTPASVRMQTDGGSGFCSQNEYDVYFGLGSSVANGATKFDIEMRCGGQWITKATMPELANVEPLTSGVKSFVCSNSADTVIV